MEDKRIARWNFWNASGQFLHAEKYQPDMQIDIRSLHPGVYFLQLLDLEGRIMVTKEFVKQ